MSVEDERSIRRDLAYTPWSCVLCRAHFLTMEDAELHFLPGLSRHPEAAQSHFTEVLEPEKERRVQEALARLRREKEEPPGKGQGDKGTTNVDKAAPEPDLRASGREILSEDASCQQSSPDKESTFKLESATLSKATSHGRPGSVIDISSSDASTGEENISLSSPTPQQAAEGGDATLDLVDRDVQMAAPSPSPKKSTVANLIVMSRSVTGQNVTTEIDDNGAAAFAAPHKVEEMLDFEMRRETPSPKKATTVETRKAAFFVSNKDPSDQADGPSKRRRDWTVVAAAEKAALERYFQEKPKPHADEIRGIAHELKLQSKVVRAWFQNRWMREPQQDPGTVRVAESRRAASSRSAFGTRTCNECKKELAIRDKHSALAHVARHMNKSVHSCPSCDFVSWIWDRGGQMRKHRAKEHPLLDPTEFHSRRGELEPRMAELLWDMFRIK